MGKNIHILLLFCFIYQLGNSQNDIQQTNYMFNEISFNPAYTGSNTTLRATLMGRKQWMGFDKSPLTQTFTIDGKTKIGAIGLSIIHDQLGFEQSGHAKVLYAYSVELSKKTALTAGFGGGVIYSALDGSKLYYQNTVTQDPIGVYEQFSNIHPTFDIGLQLLSNNLAIGISTTHIQQSLKNAVTFKYPRHYYGYMQYRINPKGSIVAVPTLWFKTGSAIEQLEFNTNFYFNKKYWLGGTYRLNEAASAFAGIILKQQYYIGYAYDFNVGAVRSYSNGTHEIFISFRKKPPTPQSGFYQSTRLFN